MSSPNLAREDAPSHLAGSTGDGKQSVFNEGKRRYDLDVPEGVSKPASLSNSVFGMIKGLGGVPVEALILQRLECKSKIVSFAERSSS